MPTNDSTWNELIELAQAVSNRLEQLREVKVVLAESCTAGMTAAALGSVPGISRFFLGSAVVYSSAAKSSWLGVSPLFLERYSCESAEASAALAENTLCRTPTATLCAAITGHLGPQAPPDKDGIIWIATAHRMRRATNDGSQRDHQVQQFARRRLCATERQERQREASRELLQVLLKYLQAIDD